MMCLVELVVLCTFALQRAVVESLSSADACKTLIGTDGICQPMKNCSSLEYITRHPLYRQHLESLKCQEGKVCCPKLTNSPSCGILHKEEDKLAQRPKRFDHPWTALIFFRIRNEGVWPRCGGTLVSERYVITNAHCHVDNPQWRLLFVRFNEFDPTSPDNCTETSYGEVICREDYEVEYFLPHPEYHQNSRHNDIGILRLATDVKFHNYLRPICLPLDHKVQQLPFLNHTFIGVEWEMHTRSPTYLLRDAEQTGLKNEICSSWYRENIALTVNQMCLRPVKIPATCGFRSAVALLREVENVRYLIGVSNFGPTYCIRLSLPIVYTNVAKYLNWLEKIIFEDQYLKLWLEMK